MSKVKRYNATQAQMQLFLNGATQFREVIPNFSGFDFVIGSEKECEESFIKIRAKYQVCDTIVVCEEYLKIEGSNDIHYMLDRRNPEKIEYKSASKMPLEYSRKKYKIKGVRVEAINNCLGSSMQKELGVKYASASGLIAIDDLTKLREDYHSFWDSEHPDNKFEDNPYTFVYDLEEI